MSAIPVRATAAEGNYSIESTPKLTVAAQPLMDGWEHGTVSLDECEYTVTSTGWNYSVCHGGNYYVKAYVDTKK